MGSEESFKNSPANKAFGGRSFTILCLTPVVGESLFPAISEFKVSYAFICKVFQVYRAILREKRK